MGKIFLLVPFYARRGPGFCHQVGCSVTWTDESLQRKYCPDCSRLRNDQSRIRSKERKNAYRKAHPRVRSRVGSRKGIATIPPRRIVTKTPGPLVVTRREAETLDLLCQGLLDKEIAYKMGLTYGTVKVRLTRIRRKFGINGNRISLVVWWLNRKERPVTIRELYEHFSSTEGNLPALPYWESLLDETKNRIEKLWDSFQHEVWYATIKERLGTKKEGENIKP